MDLYRAVDFERNTIKFHLSKTRDKQAAKDFDKVRFASSRLVETII